MAWDRRGLFVAKGTGGREVRLFIEVESLDAGGFDSPNVVIDGITRITTAEGKRVNRQGKGKYLVVVSGEMLQSDDPAAP